MNEALDHARATAYLSASSKLLELIVAFWYKLTQAATAKTPLSVLFHNWVAGRMEGGQPNDPVLITVNGDVANAVTGVEESAKRLANAACQILMEMTCCGVFTIGASPG